MNLLVVLFMTLSAVTVSSETGDVVPETLNGYSMVETPPAPGMGEWTGIGPWGGNLRALVPAWNDDSIVLAGCGFSMAADAGGVFRSTDGGVTWSEGELSAIPVNDVCSGGPAAPNRFYAATRTGLYRSDDLGLTWETVSGMASEYVIGIGTSLENSGVLIAGLSSGNGVRRSDDGGATWSQVGLSDGYMKGFGSDPEHPDTMYLAMSGLDYPVYRSVDAGLNWAPMGPSVAGWGILVAPFGTGETIIVTTSDGYYMSTDYGTTWTLAVSGGSYAPAVCDGTNLYAPVNSAAGVYESTDQGQNWTLNTQGIVASYWQAGCASSAGYLAGHYGGVYRTASPSSAYTVSQEGINNGFFHAVSYYGEDGVLLAGGEHHGLWKSTDLGENWNIVFPGPGNWTIYDIAPQSNLHYSGQVRYVATGDGVYRSDDGGDSWAPAGLQGNQISGVAFDPENPDNAWAGTATSGVHYTTDGGGTWTPGAGFPFALYPSIELMEKPGGGLRIMVCFQQSGAGVYYSDDGGLNYTEVAVPGSYHPDLSVRYGTGDEPMVYLATSGGIYRSSDLGETWTACPGSSGLMWEVQGELDENVFAGTNGGGVMWSNDEGDNWQTLGQGTSGTVVWDIAYGAGENQLFASLRGFGVAEITEDQLGVETEEPSRLLAVTPSANPAGSSMTFTVTGTGSAGAELHIYSAAGRMVFSGMADNGSVHWTPEESIPPGVYLVRATSGNTEATTRAVLVR